MNAFNDFWNFSVVVYLQFKKQIMAGNDNFEYINGWMRCIIGNWINIKRNIKKRVNCFLKIKE